MRKQQAPFCIKMEFTEGCNLRCNFCGLQGIRAPGEKNYKFMTPDVMRGVVSLPHGFGHTGDGIGLRVAAKRPGANVNALTDDAHADAPSGASALFGAPVEVLPTAPST